MSNEFPPTPTVAPALDAASFPTREFEVSVLRFVSSGLFERVFKEGMDLVEETAAYLDGPGREESKDLERSVALAYAGESMRLTTRLMQVASWLLVQRAIEEGEMTPFEALDEKYRLGAQEVCRGKNFSPYDELPERLQTLLTRSEGIYEQVSRLDNSLYMPVKQENELESQRDRLQQMFGAIGQFEN